MLSKAWFQLSADMSYVCLRITPGLTEPIQESDVLALLRLSNCRRYEPLGEGIREAVTLLNALIAEPDAGQRAALRVEANEAIAKALKARAADTLDKVLFELSSGMKNSFARSDA